MTKEPRTKPTQGLEGGKIWSRTAKKKLYKEFKNR